jgi:hypothetical protein
MLMQIPPEVDQASPEIGREQRVEPRRHVGCALFWS